MGAFWAGDGRDPGKRLDETPIRLAPTLERITNQHDLMVAALRQAGGVAAESAVDGHRGKIADVVFPVERLVVEVKSLTKNRAEMPAVQERLGETITKQGNMIIFGTVAVRLDQLEPGVAGRVLREIGDRLRKEIRSAAKQIESTAFHLGWADYRGVLAVIAPPSVMRRDVIRWVINDEICAGNFPQIGSVILGSTPYLAKPRERGDSYLSFHERGDGVLSDYRKRRIGKAWAELQGQPIHEMAADPLFQ